MGNSDGQRQQLQIVFDEVREKNLEQLKLLNTVIFPIRYQDRLYQDVLACGSLSQYAYHNDVLVGAIACRAESQQAGKRAVLHVMTLGVLAPYRGMGVGSQPPAAAHAGGSGQGPPHRLGAAARAGVCVCDR